MAALFAGWAAWEAHLTRLGADTAAQEQKRDVERSRRAAEGSAEATVSLADATQRDARVAEEAMDVSKQQLAAARDSLDAEERIRHSCVSVPPR